MSRHLKKLRSPSFWKLSKKSTKWAVKPRAGPHKLFESIPLSIVIRDLLKIADTAEEAKSIIKMREVLIDGKPQTDQKYPVGLMDVISIPKIKKNYRVMPTQKGLEVVEIGEEEAKKKTYRINGKSAVSKDKVQLNLHDGTNLLVAAKDARNYKTGDSIIMDVGVNTASAKQIAKQKQIKQILGHLKMEKGAVALIPKGRNIGLSGKIEEIIVSGTKEPTKIICDIGGKKLEVTKGYVFVVEK